MPSAEFEQVRAEVALRRQQLAQQQIQLLAARETHERLAAEREALSRRSDPRDADHVRRFEWLSAKQAEAEQQVAELRTAVAGTQAGLQERLRAFVPMTDPRQSANELSDEHPVLLLPLRLETRFRQLPDTDETRHELWVRVYPDDWAVDTFESLLSEAEVRHARTFWARVWAAGDDETSLRAAWRALVSAHGSGRSLWIVQQYLPLNPEAQPARPSGAVVLVIPTTTPLPATDEAVVAAFWTSLWRADDDAAAVAAANAALLEALGEARAAQVVEEYRPINLDEPPPPGRSRTDIIIVVVAQVVFPADDAVTVRRHAWSTAPHVDLLPDRLVLLGYAAGELVVNQLGEPIPTPLAVGPNPAAAPPGGSPVTGTDPVLDDDMRWMVDIEDALAKGMAFRVPLTAADHARGFDRLLVLGLRLSGDPEAGRIQLEELLKHHHASRSGLALLPQGTPTNNTERDGAGFRRREDSDATFPAIRGEVPPFDPRGDGSQWYDAQYLAYWLGLDPTMFAHVPGARNTDVRDAKAMNAALWPATLGYWMDTMLSTVFDEATVERTRGFYTEFVTGRGMVPGLRIGMQPYGILPTTVYSRLAWPVIGPGVEGSQGIDSLYLTRLHQILMRAHGVWGELATTVSHVGKQGDPHQVLLDILGLHPTSAEYHSRYAQSLAQVVNSLNLHGLGGTLAALMITLGLLDQGVDVLTDGGYDMAASGRPQLLDTYFFAAPTRLTGDLIDDQPLSEIERVRAYAIDGRNYLTWLADAARASLDTLRRQEGFIDGRPPTALLYLTLRHALELGYHDTAVRLYTTAEALSPEARRALRREATFVHVADRATDRATDRVADTESRWRLLYQREPRVTGAEDLLVADFIPIVLPEAGDAARLREQVAAVDHLAGLSTAKLERVFAEHLDTCGYRLDAWLQGLVQVQLAGMRDRAGRGLHLGGYGWLEDVRPGAPLTAVDLSDEELRGIFQPEGSPPLLSDPANAGYVHAPSLNQAVTAAVLRNGYLTNATPGQPGPFAVNLSSERVRRAMTVFEGMQAGQGLGELLGYQFERGLHDRHGQAEVDRFIYPLRKAFPLRADHLAATATEDDVPIQSIEARNVLDGRALVEHVQRTGRFAYPFGISELPPAGPAAQAAINAEVDRLRDTSDAVADVAIAEGIHQVVQGNYDRGAASLDAFGHARLAPQPDVVQTPRSGIGLTHRVGLHLRTGLPPTHSPLPTVDATPRARAEPAINDWLAGLLPSPDQVGVVVRLADGTGRDMTTTVTQEDLGLQPMDLLYLLSAEGDQAMTALDDRITRHLVGDVRPDGTIGIDFTARPSGLTCSLFEVGALMGRLRELILPARSLRATDLALPNEAVGGSLPAPAYRIDRLAHIRDRLTPSLDALQALIDELIPLLDDPAANRVSLVQGVDNRVLRFVDALADLALYGLPQTGFGFALYWKRSRYTALLDKIESLRGRWQEKLDVYAEQAAAYDALPAGTPQEERFARLEALERLIAVDPTKPQPSNPATYRTIVGQRRDAFALKRDAYGAILGTTTVDLASLLEAVVAENADLSTFDHVRLDLDDDAAEIVRFSRDLLANATSLVADVRSRITGVDDALAAHDAAASAESREAAATRAVRLLLGEDALFLPEFKLPAASAEEFHNAFQARASLLDHLHTTAGIDFPVDDWLYGIARVRTPMARWEAVTILAQALAGSELDLHPAQLPYLEDDSWLALPYPDGYRFTHDHLLYTAHHAVPFDKDDPHCGLLLDEWTEVIPATEETTGVSFHYNRPSTEPPNVMLLATPPRLTGEWKWSDLVDTLHETLDLAKRRAVEPDHVAATDYGRFLPATVAATTFWPITIALNFAHNFSAFAPDSRSDNG